MKLNKAFIAAALVLGSLLAGGLASQAQDNTNTPPAGTPPPGGSRGPGLSFDAVAKRLELTDDQKPKVKPIIEDMQKQLADYRKDNPDATMADRRAKIKEIRDATTAKLKDILTADQLTKWQQIGSRRPNGAGGPGAGTPPPSSTAPADAPKN
jgi:Spy/CpxP family protein refolding chaperone